MVATSLWYEFGKDSAATTSTFDFSTTTTAGTTCWFDCTVSWSDYVEICKEILRIADNKLRLQIQRKSLFIKKIIPKFQSTRKPRIQLFIPAQRNWKCGESRSR